MIDYSAKLRMGDLEKELKNFQKTWNSLEEKLGLLLRSLAQICYSKELFTQIQFERYFISGNDNKVIKTKRK